MNKEKIKKLLKDPRFYFIGLELILSIALIVQLFIVPVLPIMYTGLIIVVLALIFCILTLIQINKRVNKLNSILGKVFIVIMCIILTIANYAVYEGGKTLSSISGAAIKTDAISVIVLKDEAVENGEIEKLKEGTFGILSVIDRENSNKAIEEINNVVKGKIKVKEYQSMFELAKALYEGSVDSILMNEAYRGTFQDNEKDKAYIEFDNDTKVVYQVEISSDITDISKNVDVSKDPFNIFISGIDTFGPVSTASRSDVNMVATINPTTHKILLTSIPRDYYVAQACQGNQLDKLTHAGIFGVECSVSSIENLFGIDINYYARVNFTSLIDIVDALGGISVESQNDFYAQGYNFVAGTNHINGLEALAFSRDRYHQEGGDRGRGKNQMRVITGIINKAISPSIIMNYNGVMGAISGSFETNMDSKEITKFIQKQLDSMSGWEVVQNAVDGTGGTDWTPANGFNAYVMYPDQATVDATKSMIDQMFNGQ